MKVKILRYGAYPNQNKVVTHYEDVTFLNENVGWYLTDRDDNNPDFDLLDLVLKVEGVYFVADQIIRKNLLETERIEQWQKRALHLQAYMQQCIDRNQFIQLIYIAVYDALDWDARPLKMQRERWLAEQTKKQRNEERVRQEKIQARKAEFECQRKEKLDAAKIRFMDGDFVELSDFLELCDLTHIEIHPRTLGVFRRSVKAVSPTQISIRMYKGKRDPDLTGCFAVAEELQLRLTARHIPITIPLDKTIIS